MTVQDEEADAMVIGDRNSRVVDISADEAIRKLELTLSRMERIYEMSSEQMLEAVRRNERNDTAEISLWMIQYQDYRHLRSV